AGLEAADAEVFTDLGVEALRQTGVVADLPLEVLTDGEDAFSDGAAEHGIVLAVTGTHEALHFETVSAQDVAAVTGGNRGLVVEAAEAVVGVGALAVDVLVAVKVEVG